MNTQPQPANTGTPERLLAEIEADLERHLAAAEGVCPTAVSELTRRAERLAAMLARTPAGATEALLPRVRRIRELHDRLALAVRQQHTDAAARLGHLRKGKATLRTYGENL